MAMESVMLQVETKPKVLDFKGDIYGHIDSQEGDVNLDEHGHH